ncbi:phosphopyruvate hydratase [Chlamydiia bacterium]|nr:phosphopyruvate hydratase [Chlamydiia bacterium]
MKLAHVEAFELIDSRGYPTLAVKIQSTSGFVVIETVPSGASTGKKEAFELRDGDENRFCGKGLLTAIQNVDIIAKKIANVEFDNQHSFDDTLIQIDGSDNKSIFGANVLLVLSICASRLFALEQGIELYQVFGRKKLSMPKPMFNVLNGGCHADNGIAIQEFMLVPMGNRTCFESIRMAAEIYQMLKRTIKQQKLSTGLGDEGGFAPSLTTTKQVLDLICQSIDSAGYKLGDECMIALDCAGSEYYNSNTKRYHLGIIDGTLDRDEYQMFLSNMVAQYPIMSVEDPFHEDDFASWTQWTHKHRNDIMVVSDDLTVTQYRHLKNSIKNKHANTILIKPNQVGTVSETMDVMDLADESNWNRVVSHRSGETESTFIADLAVGMGAEFVKFGAPARGERTAKYNRLIQIERQLC